MAMSAYAETTNFSSTNSVRVAKVAAAIRLVEISRITPELPQGEIGESIESLVEKFKVAYQGINEVVADEIG